MKASKQPEQQKDKRDRGVRRASRMVTLVKKPTEPSKDTRQFWSGIEAEELIQRSVQGEDIAEIGEILDVMIDAETARKWLSRNRYNRKVSEVTVERYSADMAAGHWPYTHQGIAFDRKGHLLDGQHRLLACVRCNGMFPSQVTINLPEDTGMAIDQGKSRSIADVATLATGHPVESAATAVAARMIASIDQQKPNVTRTECVAFYVKHREAIKLSLDLLPRRTPGAKAGTRAVVARASYSVNREQLSRFCDVLSSGRYGEGDEAAIALREWLIKISVDSRNEQLEMYRRTEFALEAFIERRFVARVRPVANEKFKLPEEV